MTAIPIPAGAAGAPGIYCIDRTEVTNRQYADFLGKNPDPNSQPTFCSWNTNFNPEALAGTDNCENVALIYDLANHPSNPVACIDWCDAYAYCKSVGKRLCGGFGGGSVPTASGASATVDEWFTACSMAGTKPFPYGSPYNGYTCNTLEYNQTGSVPVASAVNCVGGYDGLFDMSGNVAEWEDACSGSGTANDNCLMRGGFWNSYGTGTGASDAKCSAVPSSIRSRRSREIGFRCCYDGK